MKIILERNKAKKRKLPKLTFLQDGVSMVEFLIIIYVIPFVLITLVAIGQSLLTGQEVPSTVIDLLKMNIPVITSLTAVYTGGKAYVEGKMAKDIKKDDYIDNPEDMM
ncbi:hypothetical protein [Dethiothermospora halolimnae]|uniref:hypothetical protein n=1 Tax=Dethiothermospora halolimnae TaxID=3114390 RepID=UPI003CCBF43D